MFTLCSLVNLSEKREMIEPYSSPVHTGVFSFTKNEKPLAMDSGSTDLILPLSQMMNTY